ncbi:MAG: hypothetical protein Q4C78_02655 [Synergistaceae bacterium]|nr:hypothetical protein [Synergistaceae bacterium]
MMKKILALLLLSVVLVASAAPAFAEITVLEHKTTYVLATTPYYECECVYDDGVGPYPYHTYKGPKTACPACSTHQPGF